MEGKKVLEFRFATPEDVPQILSYIKELAEYEKMLDDVVATEELLHKWLFEQKRGNVILGECDGNPVGFALYFFNFSTFVGRSGLYLEDLYIRPAYRKLGFGKAFLKELARIAVEEDCGRMEWVCLDWNQPSIDFYLSLGAKPMDDWTIYRLDRDPIQKIAESN